MFNNETYHQLEDLRNTRNKSILHNYRFFKKYTKDFEKELLDVIENDGYHNQTRSVSFMLDYHIQSGDLEKSYEFIKSVNERFGHCQTSTTVLYDFMKYSNTIRMVTISYRNYGKYTNTFMKLLQLPLFCDFDDLLKSNLLQQLRIKSHETDFHLILDNKNLTPSLYLRHNYIDDEEKVIEYIEIIKKNKNEERLFDIIKNVFKKMCFKYSLVVFYFEKLSEYGLLNGVHLNKLSMELIHTKQFLILDNFSGINDSIRKIYSILIMNGMDIEIVINSHKGSSMRIMDLYRNKVYVYGKHRLQDTIECLKLISRTEKINKLKIKINESKNVCV